MTDFPENFCYEKSRQKLDTETELHSEFINLITYIDKQREQAEKDCRWYFLINLSKVDENMKKSLIKKIMSRYPNIYYRYHKLIDQTWGNEMYKIHSFDPKYSSDNVYLLSKINKIDDCLRHSFS